MFQPTQLRAAPWRPRPPTTPHSPPALCSVHLIALETSAGGRITHDWNDISRQVSCTCNFIEGILEVYDKNQALITLETFTDKSLLKGKITYLDIEYPSNSSPSTAILKYRTNKNEFTNPVNIKIK